MNFFLFDLATHTSRRITTHGRRLSSAALDPSGRIIVSGDIDGIGTRRARHWRRAASSARSDQRVGSLLAVSPDGRWIASVERQCIHLWPMPDVTKPPLSYAAARRAAGEATGADEPAGGRGQDRGHRLEARDRPLRRMEKRPDLVTSRPVPFIHRHVRIRPRWQVVEGVVRHNSGIKQARVPTPIVSPGGSLHLAVPRTVPKGNLLSGYDLSGIWRRSPELSSVLGRTPPRKRGPKNPC